MLFPTIFEIVLEVHGNGFFVNLFSVHDKKGCDTMGEGSGMDVMVSNS
jgi:hypothetical protein